MFNSKLIIFASFFFIFFSSNATVENQTNPQPCSNEQKEKYVSFYKSNSKVYDLFLANNDFKQLKCFFQVFLVDGMNRTVLWVDFPEDQFPNYPNLFISHSNPSEFPSFENNLEIPLLQGSLNEIYLKEQKGDIQRDARLNAFLVPLVQKAFTEFDVNQKTRYFNRMYLMNRMNLDKLMNNLIADFFGVYLALKQPFITEHWEEDWTKVVLSQTNNIMPQLLMLFQNKLDTKVANSTFKMVGKNMSFVTSEFQFIVELLNIYQNPETSYGRNYLGMALNQKLYRVNFEDLHNFYNDFIITIDKKLDLEFNAEIEGQNKEEQYTNLLQIISEIPFYQIQFFVFEKFELIGLKRPDINSKSFMSMSRTPIDNCGLTTNKKKDFLTLGVDEKVLNESILKGDLLSIYVRCEKTVQNNHELFKMILKPDADQECEMFVLQTDLGSNQFKVMVLLDTYPFPSSKVSCMRYVRGVLQRQNYILI